MTTDVEILRLRPDHVNLLAALFSRISIDPEAQNFHPHPFTAKEAARVCTSVGADQYVALLVDQVFCGYGMLRGWDAGFVIPSVGIYVEPALRGTGAARHLMDHLHLIAKLSGAKATRLKVHPDNIKAHRLYLSLGYVFSVQPESSGQLVGHHNL